MTVVLASKGYPDNPETGIPITIPSEIIENQELKVFHSGTKLIDNKLYSHGGRVLNVSSLGESIDDCRKKYMMQSIKSNLKLVVTERILVFVNLSLIMPNKIAIPDIKEYFINLQNSIILN